MPHISERYWIPCFVAAVVSIAASIAVSGEIAGALVLLPLLLFSATPFLAIVICVQLIPVLSLAYGLPLPLDYLAVLQAVAAVVLALRRQLVLKPAAVLPGRLQSPWLYLAREGRFVLWIVAMACAAAALFRSFPLAATLGMAALYAAFAWALSRRYPREDKGAGVGASALLLGLSVLFCAGFLEAAARLLVPIEAGKSSYFTPDPEYLYRLTPGFDDSVVFWPDTPDESATMHVRISGLGIRDRDYTAKASGEFRILLIGDSYTFGWGLEIEDSLGRVIEHALDGALVGKRIVIVNGGTGGYGPWQTHGTLRRIGETIQPDLVVMQTNTANDISDTLRKENKFLETFVAPMEKMMQRYRHHFLWQVQADQWLRNTSRIYYIATRAAGDEPIFVNLYNAFRPVTPVQVGRVPQPDPRPWNYEPDLVTWYPNLEHGWKLMQEDLLAMKADSEAQGAPFVVYNMPNPFDITFGEEVTEDYPGKYALDKNTRIVETFCNSTDTDFIPVLSVFREHPAPAGLYYHNDGHLNPEGAKLLGTRIATFLQEHYLEN